MRPETHVLGPFLNSEATPVVLEVDVTPVHQKINARDRQGPVGSMLRFFIWENGTFIIQKTSEKLKN